MRTLHGDVSGSKGWECAEGEHGAKGKHLAHGGCEAPTVLTFRQLRRALIWAMDDDEEKQLRQELLMADLSLRRKQDIWEHPRNIAVLIGATAALVAAGAGFLGYKIGQSSSQPPIVINLPPQVQK
jgi:hypothetical protein